MSDNESSPGDGASYCLSVRAPDARDRRGGGRSALSGARPVRADHARSSAELRACAIGADFSAGAQAGGLARAILDDSRGEFALRAVTRDPGKDAARALADRGAEVVQADLDDEASLRSAFDWAYAIAMRDRSPFGIAVLWENWKNPQGEWVRTFAILTTPANELVGTLHDRMPAVLAPADYDRWLGTELDPRDLLQPFPSDLMAIWPISTRDQFAIERRRTTARGN